QLESQVGLVRATHAAWLALMNRSVTAEAAASDRHARLDLLRYQVQELDALRLGEAEIGSLTEERTRMSHSDKLAQNARAALEGLYESEHGNAHQLLARAATALRNAAVMDAQLAALHPTLDEATAQVQEVARALSRYLESLEFDPARQETVERRLAT